MALLLTHKCLFALTSLLFLGHIVDQDGICPLESKVQAIVDFPQPTTQKLIFRVV